MRTQEALALSTDEACEIGSFGKNTLYDAIRDGRLKARKIGRKTIILRADLEAYLHSLPTLDLLNNASTPRCRNMKPAGRRKRAGADVLA